MKHYNAQPNLIMHYISHSITPPPQHPHPCVHTQSYNPLLPQDYEAYAVMAKGVWSARSVHEAS